jgi:HlyD family secretion protein
MTRQVFGGYAFVTSTMNEQLRTRPRSGEASPTLSETAPAYSSRRLRHLLIIILLFAIVGAGIALWPGSLRTTKTVKYVTAPATRGAITRTVTATGTVNPELTVIVGSYVSGVIQQLFCDYNTQVKVGQVCAKIDPRPYETVVEESKANLAVAKAQLEKDKASLEYAKVTLDRQARLVEKNAATRDALDNAKSLYDQAVAQIGVDEASVQQRQAALDAAQVNLDYTNITSPVEGTVVSRNVTQGQTVAASFQTPTLFLIATDLTKMQVDTNVSESDIGGIKEGDKATFTVDAFPKRVFAGKISQVRQSPQTVQNVITFDAVISVNNQDLALKPGMTASTRIVIDQRSDVIRVPNQALRYMPGQLGTGETEAPSVPGAPKPTSEASSLWILREGKPVAISVVPGLEDENFTEIVSGDIRPGDQVIVAEDTGSNSNQPGLPLPRF